jgi:site-specific recombinase XerC
MRPPGRRSFARKGRFGTTPIDSLQAITRQHLQEFVVALRDRGVRAVTVNTWQCALNAFCRWLHEEGTTLREPVRLRRLKVRRTATHHRQGCRLCGAEGTG